MCFKKLRRHSQPHSTPCSSHDQPSMLLYALDAEVYQVRLSSVGDTFNIEKLALPLIVPTLRGAGGLCCTQQAPHHHHNPRLQPEAEVAVAKLKPAAAAIWAAAGAATSTATVWHQRCPSCRLCQTRCIRCSTGTFNLLSG